MWIAHYKNGETITQKDIDWADIPNKKDIVSVQLRFRGIDYTITRKHESHRFIQQRFGISHLRVAYEPDPENPTKMIPVKDSVEDIELAGQHITCVYNSDGDSIGWEIDYINNRAYVKQQNTQEMKTNLKVFDIDLALIQDILDDEKVDIKYYILDKDYKDTPEGERSVKIEHWICRYCSAMNPTDISKCGYCSSPRIEGNAG